MYTITSAGLSQRAKTIVEQHLQISSQLEDFWFFGDKIIGAIFDYRRRLRLTRAIDDNEVFRKIVKVLRKLGKYENLRSSLEAVLFEEVPDLSYLTKSFRVEGNETDLYLTFVYFRRYTWKKVSEDRHTLEFRIAADDEHGSQDDLAFLCCYFLRLTEFLSTIEVLMKQSNFYDMCKHDMKRTTHTVNEVSGYLMNILQDMLNRTSHVTHSMSSSSE